MSTYVIAEVGQNHNGSLGMAAELIRMAADPRPQDAQDHHLRIPYRADAVKFTKRKLNQELSADAWRADYRGPNSFGRTYGEHRKALELSWAQLEELSLLAFELGLDMGMTVCHPDDVPRALEHIHDLAFLKVASRDIGNEPLLRELAETAKGMRKIVSLGMAGERDVEVLLRIFHEQHAELTLLHCRSIYPTPPQHWDLQVIPWLRQRMEPHGIRVGYSDHSVGLTAGIAAVGMGAQVLEKHVTLDRRMKGSDHLGALDRGGFWRLLRDIRMLEDGISGELELRMPEATKPTQAKLGRSLAYATTLLKGTEVEERHLTMVSPGSGLSWEARHELLGKELKHQVEQLTLCQLDDVA